MLSYVAFAHGPERASCPSCPHQSIFQDMILPKAIPAGASNGGCPEVACLFGTLGYGLGKNKSPPEKLSQQHLPGPPVQAEAFSRGCLVTQQAGPQVDGSKFRNKVGRAVKGRSRCLSWTAATSNEDVVSAVLLAPTTPLQNLLQLLGS